MMEQAYYLAFTLTAACHPSRRSRGRSWACEIGKHSRPWGV